MELELTNKIRNISIENNEISKKIKSVRSKDMQIYIQRTKTGNGRQPNIRESFIHNYRTHKMELQYYRKEKKNILKYH